MKVENDIHKALVRNSIIVYGLCFVTLTAIIGAFIYTNSIIKEARKVAYVLKTDGEIIPLALMEEREAAVIQMKHHLVMLVDYYYNIDQFNYERKTPKALWLGDLADDYNRKKQNGYYSALRQFNTNRIADLPAENIELFDEGKNRVGFKITIQIIERTGITDRNLLIFARGVLTKTSPNFPLNPHGYFIENYAEEKIIEVKQ